MPMPLDRWPAELGATVERCTTLRAVRVVAETASTQDVARDFVSEPGIAVVAFRQTRGRGRLGRAWLDTGFEGVAVTFVVPVPTSQPPERLVMASAVGTARAIEKVAGLKVGIKWPNDVVRGHRKLAGVLIERSGDVALVGVGINVAQAGFPPELEPIATSLLLEGRDLDRFEVLRALFVAFDAALDASDDELRGEYATGDTLTGSVARFATPEGGFEGLVVRVGPSRGLAIRTETGERFLSAATTTVVSWKQGPASSR